MAKYWKVFFVLVLLCGVVYIALGVYNVIGNGKKDPQTTTRIEKLIEKWTDARELPSGVADDISPAETTAARNPTQVTTVPQAQPQVQAQKAQAPKEQPRYYRVTRGTKPVRDTNPPYRALYFIYTIHTWECRDGKKVSGGAKVERKDIPDYIRKSSPQNRFNKQPTCCGGYQ